MARTLTPERQKLKEQALSLRFDYGLTEQRIANNLGVHISNIHRWVVRNSHDGIVHFEGDCLEFLNKIPDKSVDVLLTDPPYSVMDDYEWDKKGIDNYIVITIHYCHE